MWRSDALCYISTGKGQERKEKKMQRFSVQLKSWWCQLSLTHESKIKAKNEKTKNTMSELSPKMVIKSVKSWNQQSLLTDADSWSGVRTVIESAFADIVRHLVAESRPLITNAFHARQSERRIGECYIQITTTNKTSAYFSYCLKKLQPSHYPITTWKVS